MRATTRYLLPFPVSRKGPNADERPDADALVLQAQEAFSGPLAFVREESGESSFRAVEDRLRPRLAHLARLLLALFLYVR